MKREEIEKAAKKYANENAYIPSDVYAENNMIEMKESFADHGDGIALLYARVDNKMFHEQIFNRATSIKFFMWQN